MPNALHCSFCGKAFEHKSTIIIIEDTNELICENCFNEKELYLINDFLKTKEIKKENN